MNVVIDLVDPPPALGSRYRVEGRIATWIGEGVLALPTSALFQQSGAWHVFVVEDARAGLREVAIGGRSAEAAEELAGVAAGERVVLFPSHQIEEGVRVAG